MQNKLIENGRSIACEREMEVRWGDCDAAGIVYYARYFDCSL